MVMPTLWFSYSTIRGLDAEEPRNSPYSLTWNVGRFLRERAEALGYGFHYVNLDDCADYPIGSDDIVIGHPWWPDGFMARALKSPARLKFVLQPYQHDIVGKNESWWIKELVEQANHCFWVTGRYWWDTMEQGLYGEWKAKSTRLDMAVNPILHPLSKTHWNSPNKRKFLCIGSDIPYKGLDMIADLARQGGFALGYFGSAPYERFANVPQFRHMGGCEFTPDVQARISNEYDGFISLAHGDANPTTLLETASWGMLPLCNKESGYLPDEPFLELRKDDVLFNLEQIDAFQSADEYALHVRSGAIRREVIERHSWKRFNETLWNEMEQWL